MNGQFARAYLGIGEVLVELRAEFPDVSVSKIRFLESEGLIAPARSPSGYRRFGPADVDQLRFILTAQRDHYLPLRVIKERLDHQAAVQADQPEAGHADGGQVKADQAARRDARRDRSEMVSRRDLLDSAGIDEQQLAELEAHGLVRRVGRLYSQDALDVASTVAGLASYGVQARHLRTARTAAERDVSLIEQVVAPTLRQHSPHARDTAGETAREIATLLLQLHRALVEAALAEAGLPGDELAAHEARPAPAVSSQASRGLPRPGVKDASA
jgi:DNA-binding transcriptional MerR regulator